MSRSVKAEAEEEVENLRLDIEILKYQYYDRETTNTIDKSLGLKTEPVLRRWYREKDALDSGRFGIVYKDCWKEKEDSEVLETRAVKVIKKAKLKTKREYWKSEIEALVHFSKPEYQDTGLFVYFHGWYDDLERVMLVCEWIELGNLEDYVEKTGNIVPEDDANLEDEVEKRRKILPEDDVVKVACQMITGLKVMHEDNIAHRDLKLENILVERGQPHWLIKLADFGFSKETTRSIMQTNLGTLGYMAPEVTREDEPDNAESSQYSVSVDIWSAGCVIFRLLYGAVPRGKQFQTDIPQYLVNTLSSPAVTQECRDVLQGMLQRDPTRRMTATEALNASWIANRGDLSVRRRARRSTCLKYGVNAATRKHAIDTVKSYIGNPQTSTAEILHAAVLQGELEVVRSLLQLGVDANTVTTDFKPRTGLASIAGESCRDVENWQDVMEVLCEGGCDVNALPKSNTKFAVTALFEACSAGLVDRVSWLLVHGARLSLQKPCNGLYPLHAAAQGLTPDHAEIIGMLVAEGAGVDTPAEAHFGATALHWAVEYGRTRNVRLLLEAGANINLVVTSTLRTPLHIAIAGMGSIASTPASSKAASRLVRNPLPAEVPKAILSDSLQTIQVLVKPKWNAKLHAVDSKNMTPLHYAARGLRNDLASVLISAAEERNDIPGLSFQCNGESAYRMAWEATKKSKGDIKECVIANELEAKGHVTDEELKARKKASGMKILAIFKSPKPDSSGGGRWSGRSSLQEKRD